MRHTSFSFKALLGISLIFLVGNIPAYGAFSGSNPRLDTDPTQHASFAPQIAADNSGHVYAVWVDERNGFPSNNIFFNRSNDSGATWLASDVALNATGAQGQTGSLQIYADDSGHVYIAWIRGAGGNQDMLIMVSGDYGQTFNSHVLDVGGPSYRSNFVNHFDVSFNQNGNVCGVWDGGGVDDEIYINCSNDYGVNWFSSYRQVNSNVPYPYDVHQEPTACLDDSGHVYVAWVDNRGATGVEKLIFFNVSSDYGQTWPADQGVTGGSGTVTRHPQMRCDNSGNAYLAFQFNKYGLPANDYLYFVHSADYGQSFLGATLVSGYTENFQLESDNAGHVYAAWSDLQNGDYHKLKFRQSDNYGWTWGTVLQVSNANDVENGNFRFNDQGRNLSVVWENNEPWQGIYFNRSTNYGTSWQTSDIRVDNNPGSTIPTGKPSLAAGVNGNIYAAWEDERNGAKDIYFNSGNFYDLNAIALEADYILACQSLDSKEPYYGAINNIYGQDPTWIVPRENALAILGLIEASRVLGDNSYLNRANLAADYLVSIQNPGDGAWYDQYDKMTPVLLSRSPTQTSEVMIAFYKLGYDVGRYNAMKKGAEYLMACQNPANKLGNDDGLLGGGKDANETYSTWRWASDNSFSYWALKGAESWALQAGEPAFADQCRLAATDIIKGIDRSLYVGDAGHSDYGAWHKTIDQNGAPVNENIHEWINYAPQMLDVPALGVGSTLAGDWIHNKLQDASGALKTDDNAFATRLSPGLSFQAALAWEDLGQALYSGNAINWALSSGLWQQTPDGNGIAGGWIDWIDSGTPADWWLRFIDTSFYSIANSIGGYDFNTTVREQNFPPTIDPVDDHAATVGEPLEFTLRATDPNAQYLNTYLNWPSMPLGAMLTPVVDEAGLQETVFSWTPACRSEGVQLYYFVTSDGEFTDEETVVISVSPGSNVSPVIITPTGDVTVNVYNSDQYINFVASDADSGDVLTFDIFAVGGLPAGISLVEASPPNPNARRIKIDAGTATQLVIFTVQVNDGCTPDVRRTFNLNITNNPPRPPRRPRQEVSPADQGMSK